VNDPVAAAVYILDDAAQAAALLINDRQCVSILFRRAIRFFE
jgi:hypothetical protein